MVVKVGQYLSFFFFERQARNTANACASLP